MNILTVSITAFIAAFLIGSLPFGYIIGLLFFHTDIRSRGSGNIGAMNALRTLGKGGAVAVLVLDALKGFVPTLFALRFFVAHFVPEAFAPAEQIIGSIVAAGAVLGHCFSPWLRFRGGKGVATSFGAIFALSWPAGFVTVAGWLAGASATRYSSVGSMFGSVLAPVALWFFTHSVPETLFGVVAALLIFFTHRDNVRRLRAGIEGPIQLTRKSAS